MAHDPKAVANWFISRGITEGRPLTHIEVQKLLYFSDGWMLGIHERPLNNGAWEAWRYGPVLPEVYFNLNHHQGQPITTTIPTLDETFTDEETAIMDAVYGYRSLGAFTLVGIAHARGGPWDRVWNSRAKSNVITNESMQLYFANLLRERGSTND